VIYVDTWTLLKWYVVEDASERVTAFIEANAALAISRLTVVEARGALNRRGRTFRRLRSESDAALESFRADVDAGLFTLFAVHDEDVGTAEALLESIRDPPLRTLDSLHLAVVCRRQLRRLATSDHELGKAACTLGVEVDYFGP
jgi:uncharacterized protein